jgi:hypothetical protein
MITFAKMQKQRDLFTRRWRNVPFSTPKEHQLQIQFVSLMKWALRPDVLMFHVPNGELRDKVAAANLKAMGVLPGVSDLVFIWKKFWEDSEGSYTAPGILFLELKRSGEKLTVAQSAFGLAVRTMGADFEVADNIDAAVLAVRARGLLRPDRKISSGGQTR